MSTWVASKFDSETDADRPQVGTVFDHEETKFKIEEVGWVMTSELVREIMDKIQPSKIMDPKGYDQCLAKPHATRPGVQWLVWVNKQE